MVLAESISTHLVITWCGRMKVVSQSKQHSPLTTVLSSVGLLCGSVGMGSSQGREGGGRRIHYGSGDLESALPGGCSCGGVLDRVFYIRRVLSAHSRASVTCVSEGLECMPTALCSSVRRAQRKQFIVTL